MSKETNTNQQGNLGDEIRDLGKSLGNFFNSAWNSEERKGIEEDLTGALNEVADTFRQLADDFTTGETGQQIKSEYEDLKDRVESGEFSEKAQSEISKAIQSVKDELDKFADSWTPTTQSNDNTSKKQ